MKKETFEILYKIDVIEEDNKIKKYRFNVFIIRYLLSQYPEQDDWVYNVNKVTRSSRKINNNIIDKNLQDHVYKETMKIAKLAAITIFDES